MKCAVAVVLIVANIYLTLTADHSKDKFYRTLSHELRSRYEAIIQERKLIYMKGFGLGMILSAVAISACGARKPVQMAVWPGR